MSFTALGREATQTSVECEGTGEKDTMSWGRTPVVRLLESLHQQGMLMICCCCAQELPESLGRLKNLKILAADQNRISKVSAAILRGCSSLQTLALHENPMTIRELQATDGYDLLEARRRKKFDKQIGTGALVGSMDEGISRVVR